MGHLVPVSKQARQMSDKQMRLLHRLTLASTGISAAAAGGNLTSKVVQDRPHRKRKPAAKTTSKQRGLAEVAKAEDHLEDVTKYVRRSVRDPGSELDVMAAAANMLNAQGRRSVLPWRRKQQLRDELRSAIARSYLNNPYTTGM